MVFDHPNLVSDSGLLLMSTLARCLGLPGLVRYWVHTKAPNPAAKVMTLVMGMIAGATNIDAMDRLRSGSTRKVLGFAPLAPSTLGTFLRTFTFGHVRQLDALAGRLLVNAWSAGAGPAQDEDLVVDLDSSVAEVYGKEKQGASYGYTGVLGYHPLFATRAGTGEILAARMRKGAAGSAPGVIRFIGEVLANINRAGVSGQVTVRADSAFWSWKLIDKLTNAGVGWSITVRLVTKSTTRSLRSPKTTGKQSVTPAAVTAKSPKPSTPQGPANGHGTSGWSCVAPGSPTARRLRCGRPGVITRLCVTTPSAPLRPTGSTATMLWSNSPYASSRTTGSNTARRADSPQTAHGSPAPCLRTTCAAGPEPLHSTGPIRAGRTIRNRLIAIAGALVNRSGTPTLRLPTDWPWAHQFRSALTIVRALPTAASP